MSGGAFKIFTDKKKRETILWLGVILFFAVALRLYNLDVAGYRFSDEGYHLFHPIVLSENPSYPSLYFKHGLMWWIYWGLHVFGFTVSGSLRFAVFCGMSTIVLFFLIVRRFSRERHALFGAAIFSCLYYVLYYHRSNMSDGYALMFFCAVLYPFVLSMQRFGLMPGMRATGYGKAGRREPAALLLLALSGLLLGFSFTVRIQTCLTLIGVAGAFALALLVRCVARRRGWMRFWKYALLYAGWIFFGVMGYTVFMLSIKRHIMWDATFEWYAKNWRIAGGEFDRPWRGFFLLDLWKLCGWPFLVLGFLGIVADVFRFRRLGVVRLWLLVCLAGLSGAYLKMDMPWPRAYLYVVVLLIFYWLIGVDFLVRRFSGVGAKRFLLIACVVSTVLGELARDIPFIQKRSGYNKAIAYILEHGRGSLVVAHSWTIFETLPFRHNNFLIDVVLRENDDVDALTRRLGFMSDRRGVRYMVLDNNIDFLYSSKVGILKGYCEVCPMVVEFQNDFGEDFHTCMDAFGCPPIRGVFTGRVVICVLKGAEALN